MDAREALDLEARFVDLRDRFAKEMARTIVEARQAQAAIIDLSEPLRSLLKSAAWLELREFVVDPYFGQGPRGRPRLDFRVSDYGQALVAEGPSALPDGRYRLMLAVIPLDAAVPEPKK